MFEKQKLVGLFNHSKLPKTAEPKLPLTYLYNSSSLR